MEDRALEEQLRGITWAASFNPGHSALPSGALPPRQMAAHAAAAPTAPHTGGRPGLVPPPGWSAGALSVLAAPRVAWASLPVLPSQPATPPISKPITLQPRAAAPPQAWPAEPPIGPLHSARPPITITSLAGRMPSRPGSAHHHQPMSARSQQQQQPQSARSQQPQQQQGQDLYSGDQQRQEFGPQGREALALRLMRLLEQRRWEQGVAAINTSMGVPQPLPRDVVGALEEEEDRLNRVAAMTIAVHRDTLEKKAGKIGSRAMTNIPGKGKILGTWGRAPQLPTG